MLAIKGATTTEEADAAACLAVVNLVFQEGALLDVMERDATIAYGR